MLRAMLLQQYAGGGAFLVSAFNVLLFRLELFMPYNAGQSVDSLRSAPSRLGRNLQEGIGQQRIP